MVLRLAWYAGAGRARPDDELVDFLAACAGNAGQHLGGLGGVGDGLVGEAAEELLHQQHGEQVLAEDHAGGIVVGELRIEAVAELREEPDRTLQVLDRQIDEDLAVLHGLTQGPAAAAKRSTSPCSTTSSRVGRTSMLPYLAGGIFEAIWMASLRSRASIM